MTPPFTGGPPTPDMTPREFREHGRAAIEWIARYLEEVEEYPVMARVRPGELREALPPRAPEEGEPFERILADFREEVLPAVTHWNHPRFHGYFAITGSAPGILGEALAAALNVNAMVWRASPAGTELEEQTLDWLRDLVGLPTDFAGVINDTASSSTLAALAAAREAAYPEARAQGLHGAPRGRIYASSEAHSSIDRAVVALGFGLEGIRKVAVDGDYRMRPESLRAAIEEDVSAGVRPVAVVATVGTTSSTGVDPCEAVADVAGEHGLWMHVDAAYGGAAAVVPELRDLFAGWERADSVVMNPHKWLFTPVDCSALFCRRPEMLAAAFSLTPEYLRTPEQDRATSLADYGVALGRRFRALKLWFVLRYFGREGLVQRIREHVRIAGALAGWVDDAPDWERMAPAPFGLVVLRYAPAAVPPEEQDALNEEILERVNRSGEAFLSHTKLAGRTCLRVSVGNLRTTEAHVEATWALLREVAAGLGAEVAG